MRRRGGGQNGGGAPRGGRLLRAAAGRRLAIDALESRLMLSGSDPQWAIKHTPRIQLGDAPLAPYAGSSTDQIGIIWQTEEAGSGTNDRFEVSYREVGGGSWIDAGDPTATDLLSGTRFSHEISILGLLYDTDYEYRVEHLRDEVVLDTYEAAFRTRLAPGATETFVFTAYGDSAFGVTPEDVEDFAAVATLNSTIDPEFTLLLGDNVQQTGALPEYDGRYDPTVIPENTEFVKNHVEYATAGNHDAGQAHSKIFMAPLPVAGVTSVADAPLGSQPDVNFSFDYGSAHFVSFDSELFSGGSAEEQASLLSWLSADLAASTANWNIVFTHRAIVSRGVHAEEHVGTDYFQAIFPVLQAGGVDLLLTGHAHDYQRTFPLLGEEGDLALFVEDLDNDYAKGAGVVQVTAGTGGSEIDRPSSPLNPPNDYLAAGESTHDDLEFGLARITVTPTQLSVQFDTILGDVLDSFTITDGPDVDAPVANLTTPLDDGVNDQDFDAGEVAITSGASLFEIQLADVPGGDGIDAATVLASAVSVTRDAIPLVEGVDYTFSYVGGTERIQIAAVGGSYVDGTYVVTLNSGGGIADLAGNALGTTNFTIELDSTLPQLHMTSFQQGVNGYSGTQDTFLHQANPDTTYHNAVRPKWAMPEYLEQENQFALLRFDEIFGSAVGQLPVGAEVTSATLTYHGPASAQATPGDLHEVAVPWLETVTPNTFGPVPGIQSDDYYSSVAERISVAPPGPGEVNVDVTESLRKWAADPTENHGWIFAPYGRNAGQFYSSEWGTIAERPTLTVFYTIVGAGLGPVADAGADISIVEGDTPTLDASGTTHPTEDPATLTYSWDLDGDSGFGDATGITTVFPPAPDDGVINVAVLVTDSQGRGSIDYMTVQVANVDPTLVISAPAEITQGRPLSLFLDAIDPGNDTISQWTVDWDDGNVENFPGDAEIVSHDYPTTLTTYSIVLSAVDEDGSYVAAPTVVTIVTEALGPVADAGPNQTVQEADVVTVDASGTTHPSEAIGTLSYEWDFDGDGEYDDGTGITTNFTASGFEGVYEIGVRVIDNGYYVATDTMMLTVVDKPPVLTLSGHSIGGIGNTYYLFMDSFDPGTDTISSWEVDWGDGTVQTLPGDPLFWPHNYAAVPQQVTISATATDETGTYAATNTLDVTFTPAVIDDGDLGFAQSGSTWLYVTVTAPTANAYREDVELDFTPTAGTEASWTFDGLSAGTFEVWATWMPVILFGTAVEYEILDGAAHEATIPENHQLLPAGETWDDQTWNSLGTYTVENGSLTVTLTDPSGNGMVADAVRIVPQFTVDVGGPYTVTEGQSLQLDASASVNPLPGDFVSFAWDLDGDGNFDDAEGETPLVSWGELVAAGIDDGPAAYAPRVRMSNLTGATADSSAGSLTVVNGAPGLTVDGSTHAALDGTYVLELTAAEPSPADVAAGLTYEIDWEGDGTFEESVVGGAAVMVNHTYTSLGGRTIKARVMDADGGVSVVAEKMVTTAMAGDVNVDGTVDGLDANVVSGNFLLAMNGWTSGDLNNDGMVDGLDANSVSEHFGNEAEAQAVVEGDVNGDGLVDAVDAAIVSENFGASDVGLAGGDVTGDGVVDGLDVNFVSSRYGGAAEMAWARLAVEEETAVEKLFGRMGGR